MTKEFDYLKVDIPLPPAINQLGEIFAKNNLSLFVVGGVVRDFLVGLYFNEKFSPKDIDLATEAHPQKVLEILSKENINTFPKGEAFGVISAVIDGKEYEIATFREDGDYTDGRRPNSVNFSTPANDAKRRDLTINALFYDLNNKEIRDYNLDDYGCGLGLEDIKELKIRCVGNPYDRFNEDKLRVLRFIRIYSKYHTSTIRIHLDKDTLGAISQFNDLKGVSPERISTEFLAGMKQAKNLYVYLDDCRSLGLLSSSILPGLNVDMGLSFFNLFNADSRNERANLAWILKKNDPQIIRDKLNNLKYSNDIVDAIVFLVNLYNCDDSLIVPLLKQRDLYKQLKDPSVQAQVKANMEYDVREFYRISADLEFSQKLEYFLNYQMVVSAKNFPNLSGRDLGSAIKDQEIRNFKENFYVSRR